MFNSLENLGGEAMVAGTLRVPSARRAIPTRRESVPATLEASIIITQCYSALATRHSPRSEKKEFGYGFPREFLKNYGFQLENYGYG